MKRETAFFRDKRGDFTAKNLLAFYRSLGYTDEQIKEEMLKLRSAEPDEPDVCGLCEQPGADKYAHPVYWPGEMKPDGLFVHQACEDAECRRAHAALTDREREAFLRTV